MEVPAISKHLANIYESSELKRSATIYKMETVRLEGNRSVKRVLEYYNLDATIAIGYRVNSYQATQFSIWATRVLRKYIMKGFALDDKRQSLRHFTQRCRTNPLITLRMSSVFSYENSQFTRNSHVILILIQQTKVLFH